eukprot:13072080-Heterocapsa_arctica.AAC.1
MRPLPRAGCRRHEGAGRDGGDDELHRYGRADSHAEDPLEAAVSHTRAHDARRGRRRRQEERRRGLEQPTAVARANVDRSSDAGRAG